MLQLIVPDDDWETAYDPAEDESPHLAGAKLITTLTINGVLLHLEAFEVIPDSDPQTTYVESEDVDTIAMAVHADGSFDTATIRGREYILIATPFT